MQRLEFEIIPSACPKKCKQSHEKFLLVIFKNCVLLDYFKWDEPLHFQDINLSVSEI